MDQKPLVGIVMGSKSDLGIMAEAAEFCESIQIPVEVTIVSAHRTPERAIRYASSARERGLKIIIAGAGGAAHLAGVLAAMTTLPVIGVPIRSSNSIEGLDSLLSMVQMPAGIPVATVAVNGARNAGILAAQIIGVSDQRVAEKLEKFKQELEAGVTGSARELEERGYRSILNSPK